MNLSKHTDNKIFKIVFALSLIVYAGLCYCLYIRQLGYPNPAPVANYYESDTARHVIMAVDEGFIYSLNSLIFVLFSKTPILYPLTAGYLAVATSMSVFLTYILLKRVASLYGFTVKEGLTGALSFAINFVMGFYVKVFNVQHYIGYQNANMWHNSTYTVMRMLAIATVILFIDMYVSKPDTVKGLLKFSFMLALTTAVKPSFATVFCPFMALLLLYDLVIEHEKFMRVFTRALTVVPTLLVIVIESKVFFGDSTGNGYEIAPFAALSERGDHPKITLILSILFPLIVFFVHFKNFYVDKIYTSSLIIWLFGFMLVFLLKETGLRSGDGNFFWGYSISLLFLFAASAMKVIKDIYGRGFFKGSKWLFNSYIAVSAVLFTWHVISGIWYFILLLRGFTYFI